MLYVRKLVESELVQFKGATYDEKTKTLIVECVGQRLAALTTIALTLEVPPPPPPMPDALTVSPRPA